VAKSFIWTMDLSVIFCVPAGYSRQHYSRHAAVPRTSAKPKKKTPISDYIDAALLAISGFVGALARGTPRPSFFFFFFLLICPPFVADIKHALVRREKKKRPRERRKWRGDNRPHTPLTHKTCDPVRPEHANSPRLIYK